MNLLSFDTLFKNNNIRIENEKRLNYKKYILVQLYTESNIIDFMNEISLEFEKMTDFVNTFDLYFNKNNLYNSYQLTFDNYISEEHKNYCEIFNHFITNYSFFSEMIEKYNDMKNYSIFFEYLFTLDCRQQTYKKLQNKLSYIFTFFVKDIKDAVELDSNQIKYFNDDFKFIILNEIKLNNTSLIDLCNLIHKNINLSNTFRVKIKMFLLKYYFTNFSINKGDIFETLCVDIIKYTNQKNIYDLDLYNEIDFLLNFIDEYYKSHSILNVSIIMWSCLSHIKSLSFDYKNIIVDIKIHKLFDKFFYVLNNIISDDYLLMNSFLNIFFIQNLFSLQSEFSRNDCETFTRDIPSILCKIIDNKQSLKIISNYIDKQQVDSLEYFIDDEYIFKLKSSIDKINYLIENDHEMKFIDPITSTYIIEPYPLSNCDKILFVDKYQIMLNSLENGVNPFTRKTLTIFDIIMVYNISTEKIQEFKNDQNKYEKDKQSLTENF